MITTWLAIMIISDDGMPKKDENFAELLDKM